MYLGENKAKYNHLSVINPLQTKRNKRTILKKIPKDVMKCSSLPKQFIKKALIPQKKLTDTLTVHR